MNYLNEETLMMFLTIGILSVGALALAAYLWTWADARP